ncbi:MAG: hypothetical protein FWG10_04260 [Eubacteriaceae bacterium]|nr:hypothetical protein [Eubacteriaceae bacterium]
MPESAQNNIKKYLHVRSRGDRAFVSFNEGACQEAKKSHGYFALVSNSEKDTFECLLKYRKRAFVEPFFESCNQRADGARPRVWDADTLRGRMFVQFVALCYYEHISNEIRNMKEALGIKNGVPGHDTKANLDLEKKLKSWLDNTPVYIVLQWFDAVEQVTVSTKLHSKRWTTEITKRDKCSSRNLGWFCRTD